MKKTLLTISVAVLLVLSVPLSAFAAHLTFSISPDYFELVEALVYSQPTNSEPYDWIAPKTLNFYAQSSMIGHLGMTSTNPLQAWRAKFAPLSAAGNMVIPPYMSLSCSFFYRLVSGSTNYAGQTITGAFYLTTPDGRIFEFPVMESIEIWNDDGTFSGYQVQVGATASIGEGFQTKDCSFEFVMSGVSNPKAVDIEFFSMTLTAKDEITNNTATIVDSIEQGFADLKENQDKNTQDIIDNNNTNTDKITQNQDENTDKIINSDLGYETPDELNDNKNMLQTLSSQVDELNLQLNNATADFDKGVDDLCTNAENFGDFINPFFEALPLPLIGLVSVLLFMLVLRKVIGR